MIQSLRLLALAAVATFAVHTAFADTVTIAQDPNTPANGNFSTPSQYGSVAYTITTSDNGTDLTVILNTADSSALPFANLYFDTDAATPGTGSNLGFEFGQNTEDAFDPNTSTKYSLDGTGVTSVFTVNPDGTTATITIPNSYLLDNPIADVDGGLVSLHLSQSFGYEVTGGSANFSAPNELGAAAVSNSPVPEPSTIEYMLLSSLGALGIGGRRLMNRLRA